MSVVLFAQRKEGKHFTPKEAVLDAPPPKGLKEGIDIRLVNC